MMRFILGALFGLFAGNALAAAESVGDWMVGLDNNGRPYMSTINESGNLFGKFCDFEEGSCFWLLAMPDASCEQRSEYPVLVSVGSGAFSSSITCSTPVVYEGKTVYRSLLSNPDDMDKYVSQPGRIGFAVPMVAGTFKAIRFSLTGASSAFVRFDELVKAASKAQNERKQRAGTKDVTL